MAGADTESEQEEDTGSRDLSVSLSVSDHQTSFITSPFLPSYWSGVFNVSLEIIWKCWKFISGEFYQHKLHFYMESLKELLEKFLIFPL